MQTQSEPLSIGHQGQFPVVTLSFNLGAGYSLGQALDAINEVIAKEKMPASVIADYQGPVDDPAALAARLSSTPGVVEHGLFPPHMVAVVLVGRGESVERIDFG